MFKSPKHRGFFLACKVKWKIMDDSIYNGLIFEAKKFYEADDKKKAYEFLYYAHDIKSDDADTLNNLGKVAAELGFFSEAIKFCEKILVLRPKDTRTMANMAGVYSQIGEAEKALEFFRKAREINPQDSRNHSDFLMTLHYKNLSQEEVFKEHLYFGEIFEGREKQSRKIAKYKHEKIRIGYVTYDLAEHAIWYILRGILPHHDREHFEIYLYWTNPNYNPEEDELKKTGNFWRTVADLNVEQLKLEIQKDEIDVLIDLSGHTGGNVLPLFAERAAPVQMSWFGYMDTTGLKNMDYRITDRFRIPENRAKFYTEKLLYLPESYAFEPRIRLPKSSWPLPMNEKGAVTFGAFNAMKKINRTLVETWAEILKKLPTATLMIVVEQSAEYEKKIRSWFETAGIAASQIRFENFRPINEFLKLASTVDVALDSFPYTGGITTYHALSVGVPNVTLLGETEYERNAGAILRSLDLAEFITNSREEYIEKAVAQAKNSGRLSEIRKTVPFLLGQDNPAVVASLEKFLLQL